MLASNQTTNRPDGVLTVVVAYAFFAGLWILLSDRTMGLLFSDPQALVEASMVKGWLFVGVTTLLLYVLVRGLVVRQEQAYRREIEALQKQQRTYDLLAAIADNSEDAIFAKDLQGRYLLFNEAACRLVGKSAAEVLGQDDHAIFPPEQAEMLMAVGRHVISTGCIATNEEVLDTALGKRVLLATKGPLRDAHESIFGTFGISRDITARKNSEIALRDSERRFHDIVETTADWIWETDAECRYTYASESVSKLLGYTSAEVVGKTPFDFMPPDEAHHVRPAFLDIATRRVAFRELDNVNLHKNGSVRHVWTTGVPILAADGTLLGYRGLDRDITERKNAETALQHLVADVEATLQAIPDLLFELDAEGRYLDVKATHEALLAAPAEQLLGRKVSDMLPPAAARTVMEALAAASRVGTDYGRTIMLPLAQGAGCFEISVARKQVVAGQLGRFIVMSRDVTARKTAEDELRQRNAELERFNRTTVGRELDMIELKKSINTLSAELGREAPFNLDFLAGEHVKP